MFEPGVAAELFQVRQEGLDVSGVLCCIRG